MTSADTQQIYTSLIDHIEGGAVVDTPDGVVYRELIKGHRMLDHDLEMSETEEPFIYLTFAVAEDQPQKRIRVRINEVIRAVRREPMLRHRDSSEADDVVSYLTVLLMEALESGSAEMQPYFAES